MKSARVARAQEFDDEVASNKKKVEGFHSLNYPKDANYIDDLFRECLYAEDAGLGTGKLPTFHTLKMHWVRKHNFPHSGIRAIRDAFTNQAGSTRGKTFPTVGSLGFKFDENALSEVECAVQKMMKELQGLMEGKRRNWTRDYKAWERGAKVWQKKWEEKLGELEDVMTPEGPDTVDVRLQGMFNGLSL